MHRNVFFKRFCCINRMNIIRMIVSCATLRFNKLLINQTTNVFIRSPQRFLSCYMKIIFSFVFVLLLLLFCYYKMDHT